MIYFTSDLHLGHVNIINHCERPFDNISSMDQTIIDCINNTVDSSDQLYILGDFCFRGKKPIEYRPSIKCRNIHIILGNHDRLSHFTTHIHKAFRSVQHVAEITYCRQKIFMSHYPHRSWPASHRGSWMLYGHTHASLNHIDAISNLKTLDVGIDNNINHNKPFGQPWSFAEIQLLFSKKP